ncbi:hypothetical protein KAU19_02745 [Candidatus Parcubacteria bacterium]|nr:hypothetical protein [Candidatus Parcubacteria bacterium]
MAKVFLIDFSSPILIDAAKKLIKKSDIEVLYWVGCKRDFEAVVEDKKNFSNIILHNTVDAVKGIPAKEFDYGKFNPLGEDLIKEMLECESITLTMITRLDFTKIPFIKKKHLYYKYLQYWNGVLKYLRPDAIIFRAPPHAGYNFVLYSLAKKYNIKTIMFDKSILPDKLILIKDYQKAPLELKEMYDRIKYQNNTINELEPKSKEYFEKMFNLKPTKIREDGELVIHKNKKSIIIAFFKKIIKNIKAGTFLTVSSYYLKSMFNLNKRSILSIDDKSNNIDYGNAYYLKKFKKITNSCRKEYEELQEKPDFNKKYIYFPLHYQPECSTSPMAKFFVDQILTAKILSSSVPNDWIIYIKEHFPQWYYPSAQSHMFRYNGYYEELANLKNVKLLPIETSSHKMIANSQAVATANGTSGWEALVKGKNVLLFGYPWYMYCDGIFQITGVKSCKNAIEKIISGNKIDKQKVLNYLISLDKTAVTANIMAYSQRVSNMPAEKSVENFTKVIYKEIF